MTAEVTIRPEREEDFGAIYELVREAFTTLAQADGDEQDFVNQLRAAETYIPELALVAHIDSKPVGHIMLTGTELIADDGQRHVMLLLAPVAVLPEYHSQGIGSALIRKALDTARDMGYKAVFLCGHPDYYSRFGFSPAAGFGIGNTRGIPDRFAMALELIPGALKDIKGTVYII